MNVISNLLCLVIWMNFFLFLGDNCCVWIGVKCDNNIGYVVLFNFINCVFDGVFMFEILGNVSFVLEIFDFFYNNFGVDLFYISLGGFMKLMYFDLG